MLDVEFVRQKLKSVLRQIQQLRLSDFPYEEPQTVLGLLAEFYQRDLDRLNAIDATDSEDVRQHACAHANINIGRFYPYLGFILRSTNVRNAFEVYYPLHNICKAVYGSSAKLVISSEWNFSPFTYPAATPDFPDLMLIGSPSTEAGNALIVPLAGHELGHSVWQKPSGPQKAKINSLVHELRQGLISAFQSNWPEFQVLFGRNDPKEALLTDLFLNSIFTKSWKLALRQSEEIFCDQIGLKIFGEGFIYSFIYLIAPNFGERAPFYPSLESRVKAMELGAASYVIDVPAELATSFKDSTKRILSGPEKFILRMADQASGILIPSIVKVVDEHVNDSNLALPTNAERDRIAKHFSSLCPPSEIKTMGDVINAGWKLRLDWSSWDKFDLKDEDKNEILNDLIFKSLEVFEFETKVKNGGKSLNA